MDNHHQDEQKINVALKPRALSFDTRGNFGGAFYKRRYYYRNRGLLQRDGKCRFYNNAIICSNCSGKGHFFKDCKKPILSYGLFAWTLRPIDASAEPGLIAAFRLGADVSSGKIEPALFLDRVRCLHRTGRYQLQVCLIQRRHTISFEAFVRGKYNNHDELMVHRDRMTIEEREAIRMSNWEGLYDVVMADKDVRCMEKEKKRAKAMYDLINVQEFLDGAQSAFAEPSWEFPKGRRFSYENDLQCALREFQEETNVPESDVVIFNPEAWCVEEFCGTNQKIYRNKYYVGIVHPLTAGPFIDHTNSSQTAEVKNVGWFSLEDARNILHHYCTEKKKALQESYDHVTALLNDA